MTNYVSGYNDAIQDCRYMREIASSKDDLKRNVSESIDIGIKDREQTTDVDMYEYYDGYIEGLTVVNSEGL